MTLSQQQIKDVKERFATDGYAILPGIVAKEPLTRLRNELLAEFARAKRAGELFQGGGMFSGHLNCFPGAQSRFVLDQLTDSGVIDLVRELAPAAKRLPNVGCNMNLPGSSAQNYHIDGYASEPFAIVNVAPVDTTLLNGAMEATPGTHRDNYKYWQFVVARRESLRIPLGTGDVMIRSSSLWHRGMPNRSKEIRPMLGFTWEEGGSQLADPYTVHGGKIRFLYNRYTPDLAGQLRERAFAALPAVASSYRFVRSMLES